MRRAMCSAVLLLLLLAGCGGTDDGDGASADAATDEAVATTAATAEAPKDDVVLDLPSLPADAEPTATATATDSPPADDQPADESETTSDVTEDEPDAADDIPADLPGGRYARITGIEADGDAYAVDFEAIGFTPLIGTGEDDHHVHFFFDTVAPENAGTNGPQPGEWFLYDGPSPFTGYTAADRPEGAGAMCVLVADAAHAVTADSGNCVDLP